MTFSLPTAPTGMAIDPQTGLMVFSRYRKLAPGIGMQVNEVWYAGQ